MIDSNTLKSIPEKPGCYLYYDSNDKIIYVGKAINLKKRVNSYFNKIHNYKTTKLVRLIDHLEFITVKNEKEALLLEENLIKKYKPRYNIILKDDKRYPYIVIEKTKENNYSYKYIRNYNKNYYRSYGPFPDGYAIGLIFQLIERIYPLKRCKLVNQKKPCSFYSIGLCSGGCFKEVDDKWYQEQIKKVDNIFIGDNENFKNEIIAKMKVFADNLNFEEANYLKKVLLSIDNAAINQAVQIKDVEKNIDFVSYLIKEGFLCIIVLFYQFGKLIYKDYEIIEYNNQDIDELILSFLNQIYNKNKTPDLIITSNHIDINSSQIKKDVVISTPEQGYQQEIINMANNNAEDLIKNHIDLKSSNNNEDIFEQLKKLINLDVYPSHIEMFDIANIYDDFVTGGVVVFKNGQSSFNDFRKYNIDIKERDDGSRIAYCVVRRYAKLIHQKELLPDLVIMDGGIIQVNAAINALNQIGLKLNVIGLVKDDRHRTDHIYHPVLKDIYLDKTSLLFRKLSFFQEKVHTFTISSFRKRQRDSLTNDKLSQVKNIGKVKLSNLRKKWPTNEDLKNASFEELNEVLKNKNLTNEVISWINGGKS